MVSRDFIISDYAHVRKYRNHTCGKLFVIGDSIHTQRTKMSKKVYHKKCWESTYH